MFKLEIRPDWFYETKTKLKEAAFSRQVDDLVVPIWPYQFFNVLQSDRRSEPNTVRRRIVQ